VQRSDEPLTIDKSECYRGKGESCWHRPPPLSTCALCSGAAELEDARWVSRADVEAALAPYYRVAASEGVAAGASASGGSGSVARGGDLRIPGPFAIAHQLIKAWVMGDSAIPPAPRL